MPPSERVERERVLEAICSRIDVTLQQVDDEFPYYADPETGEWETTPDGDWCGGHWIGLLWIASEYGDAPDRYEAAAYRAMEVVLEEMPVETMFRGLTCQYAGFDGYDLTGDREFYGVGFTGADDMLALFDDHARQIPLGEFEIRGPDNFRGPATDDKPSGHYIGAVDNIYTALPVLWRAYRETGDPRFRDVAVSHADRHLDWYIREDGSTWHHVIFDPETGALQRQYNELAYSDETCWARGQGWNIAGLAVAYDETGAERYLDALEQTTEYYVRNSPDDHVPNWDFGVETAEDAPRDTSAAALTAYGLRCLPDENGRTDALRQTGAEILDSLCRNYVVLDETDERYGMVRETCFNKPGEYVTNHETVWTDYYVATTLADECRG